MWLLADGLVSFSDGVCAFLEMDPVFFGWERVNPLCCGWEKMKPVYVVAMEICFFVVVKKGNPLRHVHQSADYGCECVM